MSKIFNTLQKNNNTSFLFVIVLFAFFSSTAVFGQNERVEVSSEEVTSHSNIMIESPVKVSNTVMINPNVNFILWFMGTKEDVGKSFSDDGMYSKKSFLTSGREPNHLLVKTLLKKALNIKSC
ncbi:hypothetical protein CLU83_2494 [Flavobacterium sp. 1]|uniref:hypothetical protein n=1 Tax=Flavobacterium sp. 1 TaxID=2035200 RepID=UPI000C2363CE|nr:hypothetical protein [Flavobacterium sp. 1]PJJ09164.1 hypothetical protein CLU83_2494 [Flavobacterium sp. 1]